MRTGRRSHLLTGLLVALLVCPPPLLATTIVVDGTCTLVDAITAANTDSATGDCPAGAGADQIHLAVDVTLEVVDNITDGNNGLPTITTSVMIKGVGGSPPRAIIRDLAAPDFRIFFVEPSGSLGLQSIEVRNGISISDSDETGGGIKNAEGSLTLTNSMVSGNTAGLRGGGIQNSGTMTLTDSTVSGNSAFGGGGINNAYGTVTLTNSMVSGNSTTGGEGGGISSVGAGATMTLNNSTVSGNSTTGYGSGGGVYNSYKSTATLNNSTVSGNSANYGGGIYNKGDATILTLTNSTVSGNLTTTGYAYGGGIYNRLGQATLINSTVTGNSANYGAINNRDGTVNLTGSLLANSPMGVNCDGPDPVTDGLNNLADDDTCGSIPATLTGLDSTLADNGGPTSTHALLAASSAINQAGSCGLGTDQRGAARRGACDSGAFEFIGCELLEIDSQIIDTVQVLSTCNTALLGPDVIVEAPTGDLTVNAGYLVTIKDGFWVDAGAQLAIGIDPSLLPP